MSRRRTVRTLAFVALVWIAVTAVLASALHAPSPVTGATPAPPRPAATARPVTPTGPAQAVARSIAAVAQAFGAGDVPRLCHPGALLDPAVIAQQAASGGCERVVEALLQSSGSMRLAVRGVALRPDLATATVSTATGASVPVDLVRAGSHWLVSFSDGGDPLEALSG